MELRQLNCEVRVEQREEKPVIIGYAARYWSAEDPGTQYRFQAKRETIVERILPGAFSRAIAEDDVVALLNHDPNHVLGRTSAGTLRLRADGLGLGYELDPPASASNIVESIRRGDIKGSSFAFAPRVGGQTFRDADINGERVTIRELHDVRLFDVSAVTFPAYSSATTGLRAFDPEALAQEIEEMRRDSISGKLASYKIRARAVEVRTSDLM